MPELPELEKVRRYLDERIIGKRVSAVTVNRRECINVPPAVYERALVGRQVQHVWRKGKTVVIDMSRDVSLLVHLMLGGDVDVRETPEHDADATQIVLAFEDGAALHISKLMLGNAHGFPTYHLAETRLGTLGPDALTELPDQDALQALYGSRGRGMKVLLLDQTLVCGLGNYYADEVLFRARVHPETPGKALTAPDITRLREAIETVISEALDEGRPEFDRQVFAREGEPCPACGSEIKMKRIQKRATHFCPKCQRRKSVRKKRR
ncbi:MAG TPA: DNA-formamidopyrimidine glycosylase family protein [Armatimonadota bacterium]|nr:DNA-formamidopyrimidine glycosylase family protein [Armatimonadota bacterium]